MKVSLIDAGLVLLAAFLGCCAFLYLLNRILIIFRDSHVKTVSVILLLITCLSTSVAAAILLPDRIRTPLLAVTAIAVIAGEIRRLWLRGLHAGSQPVDTIPHKVDLARPMTTTDIITHRYRIQIPGWSGPAVRIAHISDLHVSSKIPESYFREVFDLAAETDPDFVFVTGDFVTHADALPLLKSVLRPIGRHGTFSVLGNHDYFADEIETRRVVSDSGITVLNNESRIVEFGGQKIMVTGIDYPWGNGSRKIQHAEPGMLHLVLSHTPDNIYWLSRTTARCVFSGHLHAGQFRVPWLGALIAPSMHGRRFDHGHFIVRDTHLFVVSGVGVSSPAFRIYCQPDIFLIEIVGAETISSAAQPAST